MENKGSSILLLGLAHPYVALVVMYCYVLLYHFLWLRAYLQPYMFSNKTPYSLAWKLLVLIVGPLPFYVFVDPKIEGASLLDYYAQYPYGRHNLKIIAQRIWFFSALTFAIMCYLWWVFIAK